MGLFGRKFELQKDFFAECFSTDKNRIHRLRSVQGFKVTEYIDRGALNICAEKKQFISSFKIINKIYSSDAAECVFENYELIKREEFFNFLNKHFKQTPKTIRFRYADGINRDYYEPSYYLPDGNVLRYKGQEGSNGNWYSFDTISKEYIR